MDPVVVDPNPKPNDDPNIKPNDDPNGLSPNEPYWKKYALLAVALFIISMVVIIFMVIFFRNRSSPKNSPPHADQLQPVQESSLAAQLEPLKSESSEFNYIHSLLGTLDESGKDNLRKFLSGHKQNNVQFSCNIEHSKLSCTDRFNLALLNLYHLDYLLQGKVIVSNGATNESTPIKLSEKTVYWSSTFLKNSSSLSVIEVFPLLEQDASKGVLMETVYKDIYKYLAWYECMKKLDAIKNKAIESLSFSSTSANVLEATNVLTLNFASNSPSDFFIKKTSKPTNVRVFVIVDKDWKLPESGQTNYRNIVALDVSLENRDPRYYDVKTITFEKVTNLQASVDIIIESITKN